MDNENLGGNIPQKKKKIGCFFKVVISVILVFIGLLILGNLFKAEEKDVNLYSSGKIEQVYLSGNKKALNKIAVIYINGIIVNGINAWDDIANANSIASQIYSAQIDPEIKAIVLEINSRYIIIFMLSDRPEGRLLLYLILWQQAADITSQPSRIG